MHLSFYFFLQILFHNTTHVLTAPRIFQNDQTLISIENRYETLSLNNKSTFPLFQTSSSSSNITISTIRHRFLNLAAKGRLYKNLILGIFPTDLLQKYPNILKINASLIKPYATKTNYETTKALLFTTNNPNNHFAKKCCILTELSKNGNLHMILFTYTELIISATTLILLITNLDKHFTIDTRLHKLFLPSQILYRETITTKPSTFDTIYYYYYEVILCSDINNRSDISGPLIPATKPSIFKTSQHNYHGGKTNSWTQPSFSFSDLILTSQQTNITSCPQRHPDYMGTISHSYSLVHHGTNKLPIPIETSSTTITTNNNNNNTTSPNNCYKNHNNNTKQTYHDNSITYIKEVPYNSTTTYSNYMQTTSYSYSLAHYHGTKKQLPLLSVTMNTTTTIIKKITTATTTNTTKETTILPTTLSNPHLLGSTSAPPRTNQSKQPQTQSTTTLTSTLVVTPTCPNTILIFPIFSLADNTLSGNGDLKKVYRINPSGPSTVATITQETITPPATPSNPLLHRPTAFPRPNQSPKPQTQSTIVTNTLVDTPTCPNTTLMPPPTATTTHSYINFLTDTSLRSHISDTLSSNTEHINHQPSLHAIIPDNKLAEEPPPKDDMTLDEKLAEEECLLSYATSQEDNFPDSVLFPDTQQTTTKDTKIHNYGHTHPLQNNRQTTSPDLARWLESYDSEPDEYQKTTTTLISPIFLSSKSLHNVCEIPTFRHILTDTTRTTTTSSTNDIYNNNNSNNPHKTNSIYTTYTGTVTKTPMTPRSYINPLNETLLRAYISDTLAPHTKQSNQGTTTRNVGYDTDTINRWIPHYTQDFMDHRHANSQGCLFPSTIPREQATATPTFLSFTH